MSQCHPLLNPPKYRFYPLREALLFGVVIFFAVTHANYFLYSKALLAQKGEINDGLSMLSTVIAAYVDGDLHRSLVMAEQEGSPDYHRAMRPLSTLMASNDKIVNVYTMVLHQGKVYFVLDPTEQGDKDGDGQDDKAHLMEVYENPPPELLSAFELKQNQVTQRPYQDKWGHYFSSFSPLVDEKGEMYGILGLDVSADGYYARLKPIERHYLRSTAASFFVAFVVGCVIWFLRHFCQVLNRNRNRLIIQIKKELQHDF